MTFAAWEKMIRMFQPYQPIQTELGYGGEVIRAWTWGGQVWPVMEWREKNGVR